MATAHSSHTGVPMPPQMLGSWKCIASYFGCDERTAKRWERERGLPVHRVPGRKRSAVFAYSSELDSWLRAGVQERQPDAGKRRPDESEVIVQAVSAFVRAPAHSAKGPASRRWLTRIAASLAIVLLAGGRDRHAAFIVSSGVRAESAPRPHIPAPGAENLYLRGRYFWNLRTADGLSKAIDAYTRAIVKDPSYAEAYAGLSESYDLLPQFAHGSPADDFAQAKRAADRAIELNENVAAAHRAKAFALFFWDWDIHGSDAEFRRALALDPNSAETHQWYASTLLNRLEGAECLRQINEALRLNPTSAAIATDAVLMQEEFGDDPAADAGRLRELEQTQPTLLTPSYFLKQIDFAKGDYPGYLAELHRIASITGNPDDIAMAENAERGWARAGKAGMLEEMTGLQKEAFKRGTEPGFWLGQTYLLLGQPKEALPYFKAALDKHFILLITMPDCDWAKKLSSDPDYAALFAQVRERMRGGEPAHPALVPVSFRLSQRFPKLS